MKKIISIILIILFILIPSISVNASYGDQIPTTKVICDICGKEAEKNLLSSKSPTCTEPGWNDLSCHQYSVPAYGNHKYQAIINKEEGIIKYICMRYCGDVYTIPISEHKCNDYLVSISSASPTCTTSGQTGGKKCEVCEKVVEEPTLLPPLGHEWIVTVNTPPDCVFSGFLVNYVCKRNCGTYLSSQELPAIDHKISVIDVAVAPTCTETGLTEGSHCGLCNMVLTKQEVIPATHIKSDYWLVTKEPTDTESGERVRYCLSCDEILETETFDTVCEHTEVIDNAVEPTCTEFGLTEGSHCSKCNSVIVKQKAITKLPHTEVSFDEKASTCTEFGFKGGTYCSVCNMTITPQEVVHPTWHNKVRVEGVDPTCTEKGSTFWYYCSDCNEVLLEPIELPALGHGCTWTDGKEATCTETGLTKGSYCQVCNEVLQEQEVIPISHNYETEVLKESTCTEQGEMKYTCKDCTDSYTDTIPLAEHNYETEVLKEATCTEEGQRKYICKDCGDSYTNTIPIISHTEVIDQAVAPTCTETGLTEGKHCSVCDEVLVEQKVVEALGHSYTEEITKAPTCIDNGLKTFTCHCGDTYTEIIAKTGHIEGEWETIMSNTCVANGIRIKKCTDCGVILKIDTIAPKGHTKVTTSKSATYFENGYKNRVTCKECKATISKGTTVKKLKLKTPTVKYTGSKKKITVNYKKVKDATGFEVKCKRGKTTVTKTYNTKKSANKVIKNLKKGTYKVQIRAFVKSGKKTAYSKWTKAKKVKVK